MNRMQKASRWAREAPTRRLRGRAHFRDRSAIGRRTPLDRRSGVVPCKRPGTRGVQCRCRNPCPRRSHEGQRLGDVRSQQSRRQDRDEQHVHRRCGRLSVASGFCRRVERLDRRGASRRASRLLMKAAPVPLIDGRPLRGVVRQDFSVTSVKERAPVTHRANQGAYRPASNKQPDAKLTRRLQRSRSACRNSSPRPMEVCHHRNRNATEGRGPIGRKSKCNSRRRLATRLHL